MRRGPEGVSTAEEPEKHSMPRHSTGIGGIAHSFASNGLEIMFFSLSSLAASTI
jgi:hypothetical protein